MINERSSQSMRVPQFPLSACALAAVRLGACAVGVWPVPLCDGAQLGSRIRCLTIQRTEEMNIRSKDNRRGDLREWVAMWVGLIGGILGTAAFVISMRTTKITARVEADRLLDQAWDLLGGAEGTQYIGVPTSDPQKLVQTDRLIDRARHIAPKYSRVYDLLATAALARHRYDEVVRWSQRALDLESKNGLARNRLGAVHAVRHQWESAAREFRIATRLSPNDASAWSNLCVALDELRDFENAATACIKAIKLDPSHKVAYRNLASVRTHQGREAEARRLKIVADTIRTAVVPISACSDTLGFDPCVVGDSTGARPRR